MRTKKPSQLVISLAVLLTAALSAWGSGHTTAHTLTVTQITTDEGFVYDYTGTQSNPTVPTGFNNVASYTYEVRDESGQYIDTRTVTVTDDYQSLYAMASSSHQVIQRTTPGASGGYIPPILSSDSDYLNAGTHGMSLSTGINKTPKFDRDTYQFSIHGFDSSIVGDGHVDFFAADIAFNQSSEQISFWNASGIMMAFMTLEQNDGDTEIGWQQLDRINMDGSVNREDFVGPISAVALELSDFTLVDGFTWVDVASNATMIEVDIPALDHEEEITPDNPPKTDYAFLFAVNTTEINAIPIPVPEPVTVGMIACVSGFAFIMRRIFYL